MIDKLQFINYFIPIIYFLGLIHDFFKEIIINKEAAAAAAVAIPKHMNGFVLFPGWGIFMRISLFFEGLSAKDLTFTGGEPAKPAFPAFM